MDKPIDTPRKVPKATRFGGMEVMETPRQIFHNFASGEAGYDNNQLITALGFVVLELTEKIKALEAPKLEVING